MTPGEFIDWVAPAAQRICPQYGLPASVCIAMAAIESGWNQYTIGQFNLFGRKAVEGDRSIVLETQECYDGIWQTIFAPFKLYDTLDEAIIDWCELLNWGPYKPFSDQYRIDGDLESFVRGMAHIYATNPNYPDEILATIRACNLTQYDAYLAHC